MKKKLYAFVLFVSLALGALAPSGLVAAPDTETEAKLQEALRRRIGKGVTFVIAQRVSAIADADLILVMEDGVIVGQGTHKELIRSNEVYRGIVASQWGEEAIA